MKAPNRGSAPPIQWAGPTTSGRDGSDPGFKGKTSTVRDLPTPKAK